MIMGITHLESVWNPSGPSEVPYSSNQYLTVQELFFAVSYSKPALEAFFARLNELCRVSN
jgi:hypothetical protein